MTLVRTTEPTASVVTLEEAKNHLNVLHDLDDFVVTSFVDAATERWERYIRRALRQQEYTLYLDAFPSVAIDSGAIELPRPPLMTVDELKYVDTGGVARVLVANTDYVAYPNAGLLPKVLPAWGKSWPATRAVPEAVQVKYTVGYASAKLPRVVKQAILLTVAHWYANREETLVGTTAQTLPQTGKNLLYPLRIPEIG